jgi:uncharacterized damage-inducible protein DinB
MRGLPTDADGTEVVAVSTTDFLWFVDTALDVMAIIVGELGDELANRRPDLDGANSPYVILTHCLGVMEYWGGATVADRAITRDRQSEFTARGDVEGLLRRTAEARQRLEADLSGLDAMAAPSNVQRDPHDVVPYTETKGSVLVHILEELFQHLGQMELTRDLLLAGR